jgi:hypothetical protein
MGFLERQEGFLGPDPESKNVAEPRSIAPEYRCVLWAPLRCPYCLSDESRVTNTLGNGVRYHSCGACGKRFKSIERDFHK